MLAHIGFMANSGICILTAVIIARGRKKNWLKRHKVFAVSGVLSAIIGFAIIEIFKFSMQFSHFQSPHAIAGLIAGVLLLVMPVTGFLIAKGPKAMRPFHKILGRTTAVLVLATAIFGIARLLQLSKG
jgi:hypothetical protein